MKKPTNLSLRVQHFNKQIWDKEGKIYFDANLESNQNDPLNYTSILYQTYMQEGSVLDIQDGWYKLYTDKGKTEIEVQGQSFLHILYYLAYKEQEALKEWAEEQNAREDATFEERKKEMEALEADEDAAKTQKQDNLKEEKPLEFVEINGVTFLKGTNFVISKIC
jgi:hypothetical protein